MKQIFMGIIFLMQHAVLPAQTGYAVNDIPASLPVQKILNYTEPLPVIFGKKDKLILLDFFGTWCAPCIKALPKLQALKNQFPNEICILLVSEEDEGKLRNFIKKQLDFQLPVIVDEQKIFTKLFQLPAYPYTVVLRKNGKVIAIPSQDDVTVDNIQNWLLADAASAPNTIGQAEVVAAQKPLLATHKVTVEMLPSNNPLVQLSQDFMYAAKTGETTTGYISRLKNLSLQNLQNSIKTDDDKKAFWINIYNAFTQFFLKNTPGQYESRSTFFGNRQIEIAGNKFSLDDIEHGILRRSTIKWSLGYLNKLFPGKIEKSLRVNVIDYRLHFALNCGAKSCPPIAFYKPETIHQQLELATKAYLTSEAEYDKDANILKMPTLMGWFRGDFGGKKKMLRLLEQLTIVPAGAKPKIKFNKYDWDLFLQNYK